MNATWPTMTHHQKADEEADLISAKPILKQPRVEFDPGKSSSRSAPERVSLTCSGASRDISRACSLPAEGASDERLDKVESSRGHGAA